MRTDILRWRASCIVLALFSLAILEHHRSALPQGNGAVSIGLVSQPDYPIGEPGTLYPVLDDIPIITASPETIIPPESITVQVEALIPVYFPEDPIKARRVLVCESHLGQDLPDLNVWQIDRYTWERFFQDRYGWDWATITNNLIINFQAARIIYDRNYWTAWTCS